MCSQDSSNNKIEVVGGAYYERCRYPNWDQIFGSGFRAVSVLRELSRNIEIIFHTYADNYVSSHLQMYEERLNYNPVVRKIPQSVCFSYLHSLHSPHMLTFCEGERPSPIKIIGKNCVLFGLVEGEAEVKCEWVVFDPQSPNTAHSFFDSGSQANHLAIVLNEKEAVALSGELELPAMRDSIFSKEKCEVLVIKRGAKGALVFDSRVSEGVQIPAYKTERVWTIGSGDVFTSTFGYYWMIERLDAVASAEKASLVTACYCDSKRLTGMLAKIQNAQYEPFLPRKKGKVYLAGPLFTMPQLMFIDECRDSLRELGCEVFSPYHDVGIGDALDVVPKDLSALDDCDVVFAILDGMDPGTVFEVGYAIAKAKKIVVFVQNESKTHLQMMVGTHCVIEDDFVTAMYKCVWCASE